MMDQISAEAWLTQEADDLLETGPVGLYEFIWTLNGSSYGLRADEAQSLSRTVVLRVLREKRAQLFAVRWPSLEIVAGPLPDEVLDDSQSWSEGDGGPLIALVLIEDVDSYRPQSQ